MKLIFLGTRSYIEPKSARHAMHSALSIAYWGKAVMVGCGKDWLGKLDDLRPQAIVLTHAHPDHAFGLRDGAPCPVWATAETWERLEDFPVADRRFIRPRQPTEIRGITFEAYPVRHSIRAPAVGYRISAGRTTVFYAPDLVYIPERAEAFKGCKLYIGDGATVKESLVRKEGGQLFGHVPVRTQLTWCRKEGESKMLVSHCSSGIVTGEDEALEDIRAFAQERGVKVAVARDGMEVVVR